MTPLYKFIQLISHPTDKFFFPHSIMPSKKGKWKKAFDDRNRDSKGRLSLIYGFYTNIQDTAVSLHCNVWVTTKSTKNTVI